MRYQKSNVNHNPLKICADTFQSFTKYVFVVSGKAVLVQWKHCFLFGERFVSFDTTLGMEMMIERDRARHNNVLGVGVRLAYHIYYLFERETKQYYRIAYSKQTTKYLAGSKLTPTPPHRQNISEHTSDTSPCHPPAVRRITNYPLC